MSALPVALATALLLGAAAASGEGFIGKTVSVFSETSEGAIPVEPGSVSVGSIALPTKYRSKKHFLLITTSVQESCESTVARSALTVGGVDAQPFGFPGPTECTDSGWAFRTREWFLVPSSRGGPEIPAGALVELQLSSPGDTPAAYGARVLRVEIAN
jgi:hypothetical protein